MLQAALKLFAKHGFHATTTAQIAQQAGVSEGTIYKYFHSKDDLFRAILMPIIDSVKQDFFAQLSQFDNLDELITFAIKNRLTFLQKNIDLIKILLQEILVGQELTQYAAVALKGKDGILNQIRKIQKKFPEIDQHLTAVQMLRCLAAPLFAYVYQVAVLNVKSSNPKRDLLLVKRQILAGLVNAD